MPILQNEKPEEKSQEFSAHCLHSCPEPHTFSNHNSLSPIRGRYQQNEANSFPVSGFVS